MRILDKYIFKELTFTFIAVLLVLLLITFGSEATKLLADAMKGEIPASVVMQLLLLKMPAALEIILPLVALLAVMLAVGRLYQDQEMVVMNSCAIGPGYFKKVTFAFLLPVALITAGISLFLTPWSYQQEREIISQAQTISPIAGLVPGKFNPLPNNQGVLYAKSIDGKGQMKDIWLKYRSAENDLILVAPKGQFEWINSRVVLVLENGYSFSGLHSDKDLTVQKYIMFEGFLPELTPAVVRAKLYEKPTIELFNSSDLDELAMLQWRIVVPFGVLVMGLLGLKMSKTGPREGRFTKIFFALLFYILFNQLLVVGQDSVSDGDWPVSIGLWPVPLLFAWFALSAVNFSSLKNRLIPRSKRA